MLSSSHTCPEVKKMSFETLIEKNGGGSLVGI